jgi:hypothetical protein
VSIYRTHSGTATSKASSPEHKARSITGRDHYIIAECIFCYIAYQQQLPARQQSWSNLQDARAIFNALVGPKNAPFFADDYPGVTVSLVDEKAPRNSE